MLFSVAKRHTTSYLHVLFFSFLTVSIISDKILKLRFILHNSFPRRQYSKSEILHDLEVSYSTKTIFWRLLKDRIYFQACVCTITKINVAFTYKNEVAWVMPHDHSWIDWDVENTINWRSTTGNISSFSLAGPSTTQKWVKFNSYLIFNIQFTHIDFL